MGSQSVATGGNDTWKAWIRANVPHVVRELFAGGAAGAVAKTCVAPLERTKILIMTGRSTSSAFDTLRLIVSNEGVRGLFRGNGASCLRIMPYAAIHFSVYESYRRLLTEHLFQPRQSITTHVSATATAPQFESVRSGVAATADPAGTIGTASLSGSESRDCGSGAASARSGMRTSLPFHSPSPSLRSTTALATAAAASFLPQKHLGEDIPPTPMTSSIEVSASAVIKTVEEEQFEDALLGGNEATSGPSQTGGCQMDVGSHQHVNNHSALHQRRPGPIVDLVAGSAAGATAVLLTYPLDMVRTRLAWAIDGASKTKASSLGGLQISPHAASNSGSTAAALSTSGRPLAVPPPAHHTRIGAMLVHTARHEGIVGLYRGLAPTLYGIMPYAGLKFFVYGSLKHWYRDTLQPHLTASTEAAGKAIRRSGGDHGSSSERLPVPYMLAFGGVSGLLAQTVTYPLDVIRRRMQIFGLQQEAGTASSSVTAGLCSPSQPPKPAPSPTQFTTWEIGRTIILQDGVRGLFRGLSLNYVKVVPSTAIGFTVYDIFKSYLGVTGNM